MRPWTPAQRHMAADLVAIGTEHGQRRADGRVVVPLPLAEVSARTGRGRNCGTVYAHARALRPAVGPNPGSSGLVLDLDALSLIAGEELLPGAPKQRRSHLGPSPRLHVAPEVAGQTPPSPTVPIGEVLGLLTDIVALVSRLVSGEPDVGAKGALSGFQAELERLADVADVGTQTSRSSRDLVDDVADCPRRSLKEGGSFLKEVPGQSLPTSLLPVRESPRPPRRVGFAGPADGPCTTSSRSDQELGELLRPLAELAARTALVGLTDRDGARQALAHYSDAQVRFAVHQVLAMAKAGTVKSPIGWLVTKARQGDEAFFPPVPSLGPSPPPPAPMLAQDAPDADAEAAVDALEAAPVAPGGELARIDALIRRATPPSVAQEMFAEPSWLHATRVLYWRAQHPRPSPPLPEKKGN